MMMMMMMMMMSIVFLLLLSHITPASSFSHTNKMRMSKLYRASSKLNKSKGYNTNVVKVNANTIQLNMVSNDANTADSSVNKDGFDLAAWFNPNTRGGVIVWGAILILIPIGFYNYFISTGIEETTVGAYVGAIFVLLSNVLWASTYIFRVANKDMTYAKQLRDYENAVLQKRLEELADDEIDALMQEIEVENQKP